jgi:hypothetical protein
VPRLLVIHSAEGARTYQELGNFFASPSSGVSSHVGIDDTLGTIGAYVRREYKAWTQGNANPVSVSVELCAFAAWSTAEWNKHPAMLDNCAKWLAEEAAHFGIPLVKLNASQAQGSGRGVCQHRDLGTWGGNHSDCGNGFPIDDVLAMATGAGGEDEMGYPPWYWEWSNWYLTTSRDPATRPPSAPKSIPQWAWDANDEQLVLLNRYGMTGGERDWIDWVAKNKQGTRPDVPQTIPERWWADNEWAVKRS